jgi:hypothetical protein
VKRERLTQIVLVIVGLLNLALIYSASKTRGSGVGRCVNERRNPHAARITVSSHFLFTVFSRGDDSVVHWLWDRLALNR